MYAAQIVSRLGTSSKYAIFHSIGNGMRVVCYFSDGHRYEYMC
jgi:hypothetical protein